MDLKLITDNLGIIEKVVADWGKGATVNELERSLVLGKLISIYENVLMCAQDKDEQTENETAQEIVEPVETASESKKETFVDMDDTVILDTDFTFNDTPEFVFEQPAAPNREEPAPTGKRKIDRNKIRSLYGDADEPVAQAPVSESEFEPTFRIPSGEPFKEDDAKREHVIGEVINAGEPVLGEVMGADISDDIAARIAAKNVVTLRSAIGINDRFLMIRDLFDGNEDEYVKTVERLEEFDNIDDALLYIHDNFKWNPDSEGVKLIVELLTRKMM